MSVHSRQCNSYKRAYKHRPTGLIPKIKYATRVEAIIATFAMPTLLEEYRCDQCGLWHVGRQRRAAA